MSAIAHRRMLVQSSQALAKTMNPTLAHYEAVLEAMAQVYADDTGVQCDCLLRAKNFEQQANGGGNADQT